MPNCSRNKHVLRVLTLLGLAFGAALLGGCATMSKGECLTANWYQIGRNDGARGFERARLYQHREACIEYGVTPQSTQYYKGRQAGLQSYCTPQNGFEEGRAGRPYRKVCPAKLEPAFLHKYRQGEAIHDVLTEIDNVQSRVDRLGRQLTDDDTDAKERDNIRDRLDSSFRELERLNRELERTRLRYSRGN